MAGVAVEREHEVRHRRLSWGKVGSDIPEGVAVLGGG